MSAKHEAIEWKKNALRVIEALEARIHSLERAKSEPIAVIGLACRVPGASDSDAFWRLLEQGVDAIGEVPADRFDVEDYYDPDPDAPGKITTRSGGFLDQVCAAFDPQFFGISPREAVGMDPQQRLLLEVSWEALEHAALAPARLRGSRTGVFVGISSFDYAQLLAAQDEATIDAYLGTGVAHSATVGRISYLFGLEGPNLAIDTACSSSLVAVHQACQSLLAGESDLALAGGVNVILTPAATITLCKARMLAPDGRCKTFDATANGFARGEGCGIVVLKRLSDAQRDGDRILAVIRGSAVNQDGASSGLTVPNGPAQTRVIRRALEQAGIAPGEVDYLEAHGTGTSLGDPIEVQAAAAALGDGRDARRPLLLGSVKTNIGHLEAAAGIAGLIKVVLTLQHERIPRHLHFRQPNPHIPWAELPVRVTQEATAWPKPRRIAGVSAFGFSGTNAHVVLEGAAEQPEAQAEAETPTPAQHVLPLSAKTEAALQALAARYAAWWTEHPQAPLSDVSFTLATGRSHLEQRAALVAGSPEEAWTLLAALEAGRPAPGLYTGRAHGRPKMAWLFTGQGSQYAGMGRQLYATQPVFRQVLDDCAQRLGGQLERPLLEALFERDDLLADTRYAQPALFALELALARLWQSWGIEPDVVLGHSLGEYVAACVAGVFDWDAGLRLVTQRALWMSELAEAGAMAAVFAPEDQVAAAAREHPGLSIAAYNGAHTVVSGPQEQTDALVAQCARQGIRTQRLTTTRAFHSALIEPALEPLEALAGTMPCHPARRTLISNLTGRPLVGGQVLDAAYWRRHAREPVQFGCSLQSLAEQAVELLVELGPQPVLLGMAAAAWPHGSSPPALVATLRRGTDDQRQLADTLAQLYVHGVTADFAAMHAPRPRRKLALPTYPFQRQRYWPQPPRRKGRAVEEAHPLLGVRQDLGSGQVAYTQTLSCALQPWLQDHRVFGEVVAPGALYLSMALCLADAPCAVSEVSFREALWLRRPESNAARQVQLMLDPAAADAPRSFAVYSRAGSGQHAWTLHAQGKLHAAQPRSAGMPEEGSPESLESLRKRLLPLSPETFYERVSSAGIQYGARFRGLRALWTGQGEALGEITAPGEGPSHAAPLDPALLDACLQVSGAAADGVQGEPDAVYVPFALERLALLRPAPARVFCYARLRPATGPSPATATFDLWVQDETGGAVAQIEGLVARRTTRQTLFGGGRVDFSDWLYAVQWRQQPRSAEILSAAFLPPPSQLGATAQGSTASLAEQPGEQPDDAALLNQIDRLARQYILQAFQTLGAPLEVGRTLDVDELVERLGILPRHRRLLARLLRVLSEDDVLRADGAQWRVAQAAGPADPESLRAQLHQEHPQGRVELTLLGRCGAKLAEVLTGRTDPLGLLFPQDGVGAEELYRDAPAAQLFNGLIAQLVQRAAAALPADRRLRVLEVGAGTGGSTGFVLPVLPPGRSEYVYTDLSAGFFAAAESRFAQYPFVRYQTLDIERDPGEQGLPPHQFDLVLAANVLHATRDLEQTLRHIRQLLAPDGWLLLFEGLRPLAWVDLTFGLLEGWWRFDDAVRSDYPLLNEEQWRRLLEAQAFTDLTVMAPPAADAGAVLVARGPAEVEAERRASPVAGSWLILTDQQDVGGRLAARLREQQQHCLLVQQGKDTGRFSDGRCSISARDDASSWERLMKDHLAGAPPLCGVVHLWSLDAAATESTTGETLSADVEVSCGSVLSLVQALVHHTPVPRAGVWLVTCGGQALAEEDCGSLAQSPLWGMGKVLALEHPELACRRVDLDPAAPVDCVDRLADELLEPDQEDQIALRPSGRWVPRLLRSAAAADRLRWPDAGTPRLAPGSDGTLAGLHFETLEIAAPGPGEVQVQVHAAGLNFRDVLDALGMVPVQIGALGSELAGEVLAVGEGVRQFAVGDRVVGLASGTFATRLNVPAGLLAPLPPGTSFVQGATIPVAFVTAELAIERLRLHRGERILIHAASGGVGLAAVQLAQALGVEVFATASRPKQAYVRSMGVAHVFDSRSRGFADGILEATGGQGVDAVLNSLTGEGFVAATLRALAPGGRFVELGKRDVWPAQRMHAQRPDVDYHVLGLETGSAQEHAGRVLSQVMERFASGQLKTLPSRVWPLCEAPAAFRWMQQARHIGKIVLRMPPLVEGRFHAEGTYLITGGLGGLGLEVARWMVQHGARHLVLNARRSPSADTELRLAALRQTGAEVLVCLGDISQAAQAQRILRQIDASPVPLRGVIHAAGVLRDGALVNQDWTRFADVLAPKVLGAWHLHTLTADRDLDLFVLFSSAVVLFGNPGQANHAAANTFLDALAHHRRAAGLPATSLDWGAWSDVGAASRRDLAGHLAQAGFGWITPQQGVAALERALGEDCAQLGVVPVDWEVFARQPAGERAGRFLETFRARRQPTSARADTGGDLWNRLRRLPAEEHLPALTRFVQDEVARVLRLEAPPDVQTGFAELGMDSLMAVELRNRLQSQLGQQVTLSATLAFDYPTTARLADHLLKLLQSDQQTSPVDRPGIEKVEPQGRPSGRLDRADSETDAGRPSVGKSVAGSWRQAAAGRRRGAGRAGRPGTGDRGQDQRAVEPLRTRTCGAEGRCRPRRDHPACRPAHRGQGPGEHPPDRRDRVPRFPAPARPARGNRRASPLPHPAGRPRGRGRRAPRAVPSGPWALGRNLASTHRRCTR